MAGKRHEPEQDSFLEEKMSDDDSEIWFDVEEGHRSLHKQKKPCLHPNVSLFFSNQMLKRDIRVVLSMFWITKRRPRWKWNL